jgi:hypothetical protein
LNGDRFRKLRAGESRNISHGHPGEVKEILKNLVTILLDCGDMSPLSKGRTCLRTPNLVLLKNSRPSKNFSYELATRASPLALRAWPLHCHGQHVSKIAAFEFTNAVGFLFKILVRMRERI